MSEVEAPKELFGEELGLLRYVPLQYQLLIEELRAIRQLLEKLCQTK